MTNCLACVKKREVPCKWCCRLDDVQLHAYVTHG